MTMPVESRDDLVKRLRELAGETTLKCWEPRHGAWLSGLRDADTRIASDAKRIAELEVERDDIRLHFDQAMKEFDVRNEEIASLQRALTEETERHQWRTIESAPKDGRRVLLYSHMIDPPVFHARWRAWKHWALNGGGEWVDVWDNDPIETNAGPICPTHWQPEPDATAIRSGKPDGKDSATLTKGNDQ